jgi:hypothetical protein
VPEANELIVVPTVTLVPEIVAPTYSVPLATAVIVRIVPRIDPVPENAPAIVIGPVDMAFLPEVMLYDTVTV